MRHPRAGISAESRPVLPRAHLRPSVSSAAGRARDANTGAAREVGTHAFCRVRERREGARSAAAAAGGPPYDGCPGAAGSVRCSIIISGRIAPGPQILQRQPKQRFIIPRSCPKSNPPKPSEQIAARAPRVPRALGVYTLEQSVAADAGCPASRSERPCLCRDGRRGSGAEIGQRRV